MAQILIKIKANEGGDVLLSFTADKIVNNVSTAIGTATTENEGVNGKSFATGFLSLSDGFLGGEDTKLQSETTKYNGFMFGATNANKEYTLSLSLVGTNLDKIILKGDKEANQFPTEAVLDEGTQYEKTIYSDDISWAIAFEQESSSHTIKFTKWNRANYNACFTTLKVFLEYLELNKGWIDSLESTTQTKSNVADIQYEMIANNGNVKIRDLDGELEDYVKDNIIPYSEVPVEIYLNENKIHQHISSDSNYDINNKLLTISLTDALNSWGNKKISQCNYTNHIIDGITVNNLFNFFYIIMNKKLGFTSTEINNMCNKTIRDGKTVKQIMQSITMPYYYLNDTTLLEFMNNICLICELDFSLNANGDYEFYEARPIYHNENILVIPKYLQKTEPTTELFVKNKYDNVEYTNNDFAETIEVVYDVTSLYSDDFKNFEDSETVLLSNGLNLNCFINPSTNAELLYFGTYQTDSIHPFKFTINYEDDTGSGVSAPYSFVADEDETKADFVFDNTTYVPYEMPYYEQLASTKVAMVVGNLLKTSGDIFVYAKDVKIEARAHVVTKTSNQKKYTSGNNVITLEDGAFLSNQTLENGVNIYTKICGDIISDYSNGVSSTSLEIFCGDVYDRDGIKRKDFNNGQIIKKGEFIRIDKDNDGTPKFTYKNNVSKIYKVTSCRLNYDGSPSLKIEAQEIPLFGKTFTVSYYVDGQLYTQEKVNGNEKATKPTDPKKSVNPSFYKFVGWYLDQTFTQPFDFNNPIQKDIPLYGKLVLLEATLNMVAGTNTTITVNRTQSPIGQGSIGILENNSKMYAGDVISIIYTRTSGTMKVFEQINNNVYQILTIDGNPPAIQYTLIPNNRFFPNNQDCTIKFIATTNDFNFEQTVGSSVLSPNSTKNISLSTTNAENSIYQFRDIELEYTESGEVIYSTIVDAFPGSSFTMNEGETKLTFDLEVLSNTNIKLIMTQTNQDINNYYSAEFGFDIYKLEI